MSPSHSILIIEDDTVTRAMLAGYLQAQGLTVTETGNAEQAEQALKAQHFDLLIVDINLPGKDGLQITRELRAQSNIGIILLTGRDEDVDRIVGLELGADDYVTKPFNRRELLARVKSVLRRVAGAGRVSSTPRSEDIRRFEGWTFDLLRRSITSADGRQEVLTRAEYELLRNFVEHPGEVMSRQRLMAAVTGRGWDAGDRTVDVLVRRLRLKLEADPSEPHLICTAHGEGYIFAAVID